jgi:hypothetical protein
MALKSAAKINKYLFILGKLRFIYTFILSWFLGKIFISKKR